MFSPREGLKKRLQAKADSAKSSGNERASSAYREAAMLTDEVFYGRSFGEAAAVLTTRYQAKAARADTEDARLAWYASVTALEQLMDELGSGG